ncbi:MAG: HU family DNA-binding protein [Muribaculaceae bacterium]|nr:HU family DNA-binding protein [Muribaculaceae bacterium]
MNNKITFPKLATLLADHSGRSKRFSEDFLREFFSLISETLENQDTVKIKGFGTFRLTRVEARKSVDVTTGEPMEIAGHTKVVFIPAKELAEAVNAPFEAFTAIEISDDADIEQLFSKEEILQAKEEESSEDATTEAYPSTALTEFIQEDEGNEDANGNLEIEDASEEADASDATTLDFLGTDEEAEESMVVIEGTDEEAEESTAVIERPDEVTESATSVVETEEASDVSAEEEADEAVEIEEGEIRTKRSWVRTLLIGLVAAMVALFAIIIIWYVYETNDFNKKFTKPDITASANQAPGYIDGKDESSVDPIDTDTTDITDSAEETGNGIDAEGQEEVPTAPSDAIVYDTISTTRYLTTMAKAHYGNYNLWPYIYQENKSFLGHPDRIRPGTPVVIPKLSKYGVDPSRAEDIEKAKKLGVEIYARYGKKI